MEFIVAVKWRMEEVILINQNRFKKLAGVALTAALFVTSSVYADGYLYLGIGIEPDLGGLTGTIAKDGLDSIKGKPNLVGYTSNPLGCYGESAATQLSCGEVKGTVQDSVIPENELLSFQRVTAGALRVTRAEGGMIGLNLNVAWENQGESTWWRVGVERTERIRGGRTEAELAGIQWYKIHFNYSDWRIPILWGLRAEISKAGSSVYGGLGIYLYDGGWSISGNNIGDIPTNALGGLLGTSFGVTATRDEFGRLQGGAIVGEDAAFRVRGFGFNFLIGVDAVVGDGKSKLFFEIDHKLGGGYDKPLRPLSVGGSQHLAPFVTYPIKVGGTSYKFGYKMAM